MPGFFDRVNYSRWRRANPNCCCTHDEYDQNLNLHADCPIHGEPKNGGNPKNPVNDLAGERCSACTRDGVRLLRSECPMHSRNPNSPGVANIGFGARKTTPAYDPPPTHYDGKGIDPWAVWDAFDLDRYTANAVKYLLRAGKKDIAPRLDDLRKARNYINKAIEREEQREADQGS